MPDPTLLQRFDAVVQAVAEPEVRPYLEEARRCFAADAHNGAVVMAWCGVAGYMRLVVGRMGCDFFAYHYRKLWAESPPGELWHVNDSRFQQTCERMGVLGGFATQLGQFRDRRNMLAHPSGEFVSQDEALGLLESASPLLARRADYERIVTPIAVREYVSAIDERCDAEALAKWVDETKRLETAHIVLSAFLDNEDASASGCVGAWRAFWGLLDEVERESLWARLETAVHDAVDRRGWRLPQEIEGFIVWPADPNHAYGNSLAEIFLTWLEAMLATNEFSGADLDFARKLRDRVPQCQRERVGAVIQQMAGRLAQ